MIRPLKIFIVLLSILAVLVAISIFWPKQGVKFGSRTLHYPSILDLINFDTAQTSTQFALHNELALLDKYIDSISLNATFDSSFIWKDVDIFETADTSTQELKDTTHASTIEIPKHSRVTIEILKSKLEPIQFPDTTLSALAGFFNALSTETVSKKQVRIMHYGDSQIEGDRITSFLRTRLQAHFGGGGIGLLSAVPHSYQPGGVSQSISSNWEQMMLSDFKKGPLEHRFGILGGYSRFISSKKSGSGGFSEAWIRFERRGSSQLNSRNFTQCKVFYGYGGEPFMASIAYGGKTQDAEMMPAEPQLNFLSWKVPLTETTIQVDFKGDDSPLIFGVSLETVAGIVVDNIPIRGSSGTDFTRADENSLRAVLQTLNPKLIILQFGVNVAPNIVSSYTYYENQIYQQIAALKRAKPDVAVIIIGISDMSRREGNKFVSYPNIEKIREAQRNAAFRGGAAFWDCYKAMGGENSMPAWVYATPALASKDFVHFTLRGSNLIGEMFYASLMESYNKFQEKSESNASIN
jgi:lysophospholipase L1-like esterase